MENVYPVLMVPYILGMVNVLPVLMDKLKWMAFVSTVQIIVLPTFLGQGLLEFIYLDRRMLRPITKPSPSFGYFSTVIYVKFSFANFTTH